MLWTWEIAQKVKVSKVVRRGCKRSFGHREQEASCTGAKWGCTGAKEGLGGAKDSWETFAPWAQKSQKDLLHPPLTTFGDFPFVGNFPGPQHPNIILSEAQVCIRSQNPDDVRTRCPRCKPPSAKLPFGTT